jgi:hypothetical protein
LTHFSNLFNLNFFINATELKISSSVEWKCPKNRPTKYSLKI